METKKTLVTTFKNCLDILRSEGLTGEKAMRNLSYFLTLKLIEPLIINKDIDIENYNYDFSDLDNPKEHAKKLFSIVLFSNLAKEDISNISNVLEHLWGDVLSVHPATKKIFLENKKFDIKYSTTYKKIIDKIASLDLTHVEYDILGDAYEEVIKDIMVGKVLGQFFTPPLIKKLMIDLINPKVYPDGKIDSCADPTMGTGGFLTTYIQDILNQAKYKNIDLDWDYIKNEGIYGKDIEPDTYQLAMANMLISSGHIFDKLENGDSIRTPITRKFDNILANPPFGIKGINYDEIHYPLKNEYIPIKSGNAVSLFIQGIIHMLKIDGKCAIVMPDGKDLISKTNKSLIAIREYLLKTCDLQQIIRCPYKKMFTNAYVKTCIFFFVKKREGSEVLTVDIKKRSRTYNFSKEHQTKNVEFYDYNVDDNSKKLLINVPIEDIVKNSYSLNYSEYIEEENEEYRNEIVIKPLGEICEDISTRKNIASSKRIDGPFKFFTCSRDENTHNEYHYEGTFIIHGSRGTIKESIFMTNNEKFSIGTSMFVSKVKNENECMSKYIYYYLKLNSSVFDKYINGSTIPMINKEDYYSIKIPLPPFERQKEIIEYLDYILEKTNKTSDEKISELKRLNKFYVTNQKIFGENVIKPLGEICEFLPKSKRKASDGLENGTYPFFTSSQQCNKYCDVYDYEGESLIIGTGGLANIKYSDKFSCSTDNFIVKVKKELSTKYLYYFLLNNIELLQKGFVGVGLQHISKDYIINIKIPVPSIERQKDIVKYCENNDNLITQLEKEIENNKKQSQQFIINVVKSG